MKKKSLLTICVLLSLISNAQDRLFTYTYQSNVLNKGQREIEAWNTVRAGKTDYFMRLDNRTEYEIGLGKNLQTAFYLNLSSQTTGVNVLGTKTFDTQHELSFSNEWKYKILDPVANPVGLAIYGEYGIGTTESEIEAKIILDKKISKFTLAANAVYELELEPEVENNEIEFEGEHQFEFNAAAAYELKKGINLTLESSFKNKMEEGKLEHSALFAGLGFSYTKNNYFINFTVLPQIASFKGQSGNGLNLNEFEKGQARILFSYAL